MTSLCFPAKQVHAKRARSQDLRLSKREFREYVYLVVDHMSGGEEGFDFFVDFLLNSVEVKLGVDVLALALFYNIKFQFCLSCWVW